MCCCCLLYFTFSRSRSMLSLFPPGDVSVKSTKGLIDELGELGGTPEQKTKKIVSENLFLLSQMTVYFICHVRIIISHLVLVLWQMSLRIRKWQPREECAWPQSATSSTFDLTKGKNEFFEKLGIITLIWSNGNCSSGCIIVISCLSLD